MLSRYTHCNGRVGFTLMEVMLAMSVLSVGMTSVMVVFATTLRWAEEVKLDLTALQTARMAIYDAGILTDEDDILQNFKNDEKEVKGWLNAYYIVRSVDASKTVTLQKEGGTYVEVTVKVYYGGTDMDGELVHDIRMNQILPSGY